MYPLRSIIIRSDAAKLHAGQKFLWPNIGILVAASWGVTSSKIGFWINLFHGCSLKNCWMLMLFQVCWILLFWIICAILPFRLEQISCLLVFCEFQKNMFWHTLYNIIGIDKTSLLLSAVTMTMPIIVGTLVSPYFPHIFEHWISNWATTKKRCAAKMHLHLCLFLWLAYSCFLGNHAPLDHQGGKDCAKGIYFIK